MTPQSRLLDASGLGHLTGDRHARPVASCRFLTEDQKPAKLRTQPCNGCVPGRIRRCDLDQQATARQHCFPLPEPRERIELGRVLRQLRRIHCAKVGAQHSARRSRDDAAAARIPAMDMEERHIPRVAIPPGFRELIRLRLLGGGDVVGPLHHFEHAAKPLVPLRYAGEVMQDSLIQPQ